MPARPTATMSECFLTHGLAGIELHHAQMRRVEIASFTPGEPPMSHLRQLVANALIAAGTLLAGRNEAPCCKTGLAT